MQTFFFDHLPLHPPPEADESLTGYLRRLADANMIPSVSSLSQLLGFTLNYQTYHTDIPLSDYSSLALISAQPEAALQRLTFQHLMAKFGRGATKYRAGPFLGKGLAFHLRYCPNCLSESLYYRLIWRFQVLPGCPHHGCAFVDACPACSERLPLLTTPFRLDQCPKCGADLTGAPVESLTPDEHATAIRAYHELTFLLSPHDWLSERVASALGPWLAALRKEAGLRASELAELMGTSEERIKGLETREYRNRRGVRLEHYLAYAAALDQGLTDIFLGLAQQDADSADLLTVNRRDLYKTALLERMQGAAAALEAMDVIVTQTAIGQYMGMGVPTLRYYDRPRAFLEQFSDEARLQALREEREDGLIEQAQAAVQQLRDQGKRVTAAAIGRMIGRAPEGFHYYSRLKALVEHETDDRARYEAMLFGQVMTAIEVIEQAGLLVTQREIADRVGMTPEGLKRYPSTAQILDKVARDLERYYAEKGDDLVRQIDEAVAYLRSQSIPVEQETIAEVVGLTVNGLRHYPQAKSRLSAVSKLYREENFAIRAEKREEEMIEKIHAAAEALFAEGCAVNRESLLERAGIPKRTISAYIRAREVLKQVIADYQHRKNG